MQGVGDYTSFQHFLRFVESLLYFAQSSAEPAHEQPFLIQRRSVRARFESHPGFINNAGGGDYTSFQHFLRFALSLLYFAQSSAEPSREDTVMKSQWNRCLRARFESHPGFINYAGGGIRTHEPLRDRSLSPAPLTKLGDPCGSSGEVNPP